MPAIKMASSMGYTTILIDYLPDNPGQHVADKWYQESTTDIEAVSRIAKEEGVSGILAYASDPAALPAAIVSQRLGLPTNPVSAVKVLGEKHEFRKFLKEKGFPCPDNFTFTPDTPVEEVIEKISTLRLPVVIKPTDSSGSKGVSFHNDTTNVAEAIKFADQYSRNKVLICEEFIERGYPDVIGGDIFVEHGRIVFNGAMACLRGDNGKSLIPIGEKYPNGLNEVQQKNLQDELQKLITALGIDRGELNIEVLMDREDVPHFLEVGPRAGGNMIPIELSDAFGIDLIRANVAAAMGQPVDLKPVNPEACYMTYVLHSYADGIFDHVEYSPEVEPLIYRKVEYKNEGDEVEYFDGAGKAVGIVFMRIPDVGKMNELQPRLEELIKVVLK